jgi:3-hydroxy acid dehydrogenase/malonic semialdehyde reductase
MTELKNKIVFVTGASSGIGEACARAFAAEGCRLILCARRKERLEKLAGRLGTPAYLAELDVRREPAVRKMVQELPAEWQKIDILVNNAGLARGFSALHEGDLQDWEEMIDTNIKGLLYITREVVKGMIGRNSGHIVNIGSIAGHEAYPGGNVYCATKYAVDAITKGLRMDLLGTEIRVSTVDPGLVETEFSMVRFHGDTSRAANVYKGMKPLSGADIADAVLYCATRPPHVQIAEMIIFPTAQRSATMVSRQSEHID